MELTYGVVKIEVGAWETNPRKELAAVFTLALAIA